jgi:hypothetical protein
MFLLSLLLLLSATMCHKEEPYTCDDYLEEMQELKLEIDALIDSASCTENSECRSIAFGSKPCGGPWSYLIYSSAINTELLTSLVTDYNNLEDAYNKNCDAFSDCSLVNPPNELACEDGKCVIVN